MHTTSELLVDNGDVRIRVELTGRGPTLLCVHGWPELAHSWRHQVAHFAARGHRVAAIDVRGYGGSSAPAEVERYTLDELAGDVAAVVDALDAGPVVLVGHDWGAPIVQRTALRHPDRVRAVASLSVPYTAPSTFSLLDVHDRLTPDHLFYMRRFQRPDAEDEFERDMRAALQRVFHGLSGDAERSVPAQAPRGAPFLPQLEPPPAGPLSFLTDADLDHYTATFGATGFTGALNRYRAMRLDVAAQADLVGATLDHPSCFIAGDRDLVRQLVPGRDGYADPGRDCTDLRGSTILPGVGHWVQQEAPDEVNAALERFLATL